MTQVAKPNDLVEMLGLWDDVRTFLTENKDSIYL